MALGIVILSVTVCAAQPLKPKRTNLLDVATGAVVISVSSIYSSSWSGLNLIDGTTKSGWCSAEKAPFPHTLLIELPQTFSVTNIAVNNANAQDSSYPGISSKGITVYGSTTSASSGFIQLAAMTVSIGMRKEVTLAQRANVQWLKFIVHSNWGNAEYTEIMELEAYGRPVGPPPKVDVTGVYQTNYGALRIEQDGTGVAGCYDHDGGALSGNMNGRVMQFEWREREGRRTGTGIMVLSMKGDALNGVWFEQGELQGEWSGKRGGPVPQCTTAQGGTIAAKLASTGKATLYGIYFDPDSARLKPDSDKTLNEILNALKAGPTLKLQVAGHTDATNTDDYNLKLSQQRAEAVVAWLVARGATAANLSARGYGESQPVADNATTAGRALNRRVELVVQ